MVLAFEPTTHTYRLGPAYDLSVPIVVVDDEFVIRQGSDALERLLGVDGDDLIGSPFGRWLAHRDVALAPRLMGQMGGTYRMQLLGGDGRPVAVHLRVQPLSGRGDEWGIWIDRILDETIDLTHGGPGFHPGEAGEVELMEGPSTP